MSTGQIIPPGHSPPFAIVEDDDHRAWILVAAALGVSFTLVTLITRILIRLFVNRGWGLDDTLCVVSTVRPPVLLTAAFPLTHALHLDIFLDTSRTCSGSEWPRAW